MWVGRGDFNPGDGNSVNQWDATGLPWESMDDRGESAASDLFKTSIANGAETLC